MPVANKVAYPNRRWPKSFDLESVPDITLLIGERVATSISEAPAPRKGTTLREYFNHEQQKISEQMGQGIL